ncbi:MAG: 4Fe-4S binding protein [Promethearchaeota archaeon]
MAPASIGSKPRVGIFYFSQSGNTRLVAQSLYEEFKSRGILAGCKSFTYPEERENLPPFGEILDAYDLFLVGSPVHYLNPVRIVTEFIGDLGRAAAQRDMRVDRKFSATFCTYGGFRYAGSLRTIGEALRGAKMSVLGGLALAAPSNFPGNAGVGGGGDGDPLGGAARELVRQFVERLLEKLAEIRAAEDRGERYTSRGVLSRMEQGGLLDRVGGLVLGNKFVRDRLPPVMINHDLCQRCMKCVVACPTGNVAPDPHLIQVGDDCLKCYQCVQACPHGALFTPTGALEFLVGSLPRRTGPEGHKMVV